MDTKTRKTLLTISNFGLLIGGLIFIGLSFFNEDNNTYLTLGLSFISLGNIFSILRCRKNKTEE